MTEARSIDQLLAELTLEEKASLTAGGGIFNMAGVARLGIPTVGVTDGPNGARGIGLPGMDSKPSNSIPCATALGATWDVDLVTALGTVVGRDAVGQGCRGLLAPTVNLHRSPFYGRNFECYSEDPFLTGKLAAGFIRGAQSNHLFTTVKHFVGNEAETERNSMDSVIDERSLRELYLLPFEMVVREGGSLGVMTSYNRVNGSWVTEQRSLMIDILRDEWGFEGLVMTDWFAVASTDVSLGAGLDVEMPGPGRSLGDGIAQAVRDGRVAEADLDRAVRQILSVFERIGILGKPDDPVAPHPADATTSRLLRDAVAASSVLYTNDGILPLVPATLQSVAIIGPRAIVPSPTGGGSAQLSSHAIANPSVEIAALLGDTVKVTVERGCEPDPSPVILGRAWMPSAAGFTVERFDNEELAGAPLDTSHLDELRYMIAMIARTAADTKFKAARVSGSFTPSESGRFDLLLGQAGKARVIVDGTVVLDGFTNTPEPGGVEFFGMISKDLTAPIDLVAGQSYDIVVEYAVADALLAGFRVGARTADQDAMIERAVAAAAAAEVVVLLVGTSADSETEGRDRTDLHLPGRQDELIERVCAANPRTVVVLNAGSIAEMPWIDDAAAVVQCWFGGQETGGGIADVLVGVHEPGGRLPTTLPYRVEHNPSYDNFPGENGQVRYGEGLFMGYRGYEHRHIEPRFPFGHGLGYTTFTVGVPRVSSSTFRASDRLVVAVDVTNTGTRPGSQVVQCYVAPHSCRLVRPHKELKGFAKVHLQPGETATVEIELGDRSFSYWDPGQHDFAEVSRRLTEFPMLGPTSAERREKGWQLDAGNYDIVIGTSSAAIVGRATVEVVNG